MTRTRTPTSRLFPECLRRKQLALAFPEELVRNAAPRQAPPRPVSLLLLVPGPPLGWKDDLTVHSSLAETFRPHLLYRRVVFRSPRLI